MILGIDASNIKSGGGVTHIKELLANAKPEESSFRKVFIWASQKTLDQIPNMTWLEKVIVPNVDRGRLKRWYWQKYELSDIARKKGCSILFIPGSSFSGDFRPFVTMSQNLLPFEWKELMRYGFSFQALRLMLLYFFQGLTFRKSQGIIFLTNYAKDTILTKLSIQNKKNIIVSHGIHERFFSPPKEQQLFLKNEKTPIKLLYVSFIGEYKHQWNVIEAVSNLRKQGYSLRLDLVGGLTEKNAKKKLFASIQKFDPRSEFVFLHTDVPYDTISEYYKNSDLFVFASTCENLPNILIEAMAASLPIVSSEFGPMPEVMGDAGLYCNPLDVDDISEKLKKMIDSKEIREKFSKDAFRKAHEYSWNRNAKLTFDFLKSEVNTYQNEG